MKPTKKRFAFGRASGLNGIYGGASGFLPLSFCKRWLWPLCVIGLFWLGAGCSSVPDLDAQPMQRLEQDGVVVDVYPMTTKSEVKRTFKLNLLDRGVLPVRVKVENRHPSASFVIAKDKIVLMNAAAQMTNASGQVAKNLATWSKGKQVAAKVGVALTGVPAALAPVVLLTPLQSEFVFKPDEEKLTAKEFVTRTIGPGQMADGFVYFRYSNPSDSDAYHLVCELKNLTTGEVRPYDLKLNLNPNKP